VRNDIIANSPDYRPDIDGLRAICVVAVILFHAGVPGFSGGFVGVDVFLVISGYLITRLLLTPSEQSPASRIAEFYLRRARRILPALLLLLIVSTVVAATLFLPSDFRHYGRSLSLAAAMLGNVGAWLGGGYFDLAGPFAPLQHLWSIGLEEQFYLVYPITLLLVMRYLKPHRRSVFTLLLCLSLAACIWASYHHPVAGYFMLPTRAWQLLLGALTALIPAPTKGYRTVNEALALLGVAVILTAVFAYRPSTSYPGWLAIAPSIGASILIGSGIQRPTMIARALSIRPLVFTGLISYSLYLWHAPILAFFVYYNISDPTIPELVVLLAAMYLIAAAVWALLETPIRSKVYLRSNPRFLVTMASATIVLVVVGRWCQVSDGFPDRFPREAIRFAAVADQGPVVDPKCIDAPVARIEAGDLCSYGPSDESALKVVVWGDSHAFQLLPAYESLARSRRVHIYFGIVGACRPVLLPYDGADTDYWSVRCAEFNAAMLKGIRRLNPDLVILNAYWLDRDINVSSDWNRPTSSTDSRFLPALEQTVEQINPRERSICAILTVPTYRYPVPYALAMAYRRKIDNTALTVTRAEALEQYGAVENELRLLGQRHMLRIADPKDLLCGSGSCRFQGQNGEPLYRDRHHLSIAGAQLASSVVNTCLADVPLRDSRRRSAATPVQ
jgi:peptidoglycan/LPS O-acetylase OafA/YrhL